MLLLGFLKPCSKLKFLATIFAIFALVPLVRNLIIYWNYLLAPSSPILSNKVPPTSFAIAKNKSDEDDDKLQLSPFCSQFFNKLWPASFEIFLPVPPTQAGYEELTTLFLPSYALFWPKNAGNGLLVLTDDQINQTSASIIRKISEKLWSSDTLKGYVRPRLKIANMEPPGVRFYRGGWDRQQWLMFWADNFTNSEYVGFLDTDTVFVTRVTAHDLFASEDDDGRPIIRAIFGKPYDDVWWWDVPEVTEKLIGKPEPFACMSYFPVVIKLEHLALIREHIRRHLNVTTFDEAFFSVASKKPRYSQFSIFCTYLWHFHQDSYFWIVTERIVDYKGPLAPGQVKSMREAGISRHLLARQRPHIAIHWSYETFRKDFHGYSLAMKTGICYSMTDKEKKPWYCGNIAPRRKVLINRYEWTFESFDLANNKTQAFEAHLSRLNRNDQCPHNDWNYQLLLEQCDNSVCLHEMAKMLKN